MSTPPSRRPPPALFPVRHFLAPVGNVLRGGALREVRPSPKVGTHAALTAEAPAATLLITDLSDRPVSELPTFDHEAGELVVVVGQPVRLKVRTDPVHPMTGVMWSVGMEAVHVSTVQTPARGTAVPLTDHLRETYVEFHWIDGGSKTVKVSAIVGGRQQTVSLRCRVLTPTVILFKVRTAGFKVFRNDDYREGTGEWLVLGQSRYDRGCQRSAIATAPYLPGDKSLGSGQFGFIQLVSTVAGVRDQANGFIQAKTTLDQDDIFVLDLGQNPNSVLAGYGSGMSVSAGRDLLTEAGEADTDSPGVNLHGKDYGSLWNHFRLYLVYKPAISGSIWVTLQTLEWACTADIARNTAGVLGEPTDVGVSPEPGTTRSGVASSELPIWKRSTSMLKTVVCNGEEFGKMLEQIPAADSS